MGHPNPLRVHRARDRTDLYPLNGSKHGPTLGLFDDAVYPNCHCELSPHDTLLLFTDGLYEVEGAGGDIYDDRRLLEAVSMRRELPAFQLCHEVIEEVQRFSAGRHFSDDVCLVGPMSISLVLRRSDGSRAHRGSSRSLCAKALNWTHFRGLAIPH